MDSTKAIRKRPDAAGGNQTEYFRGLLPSGLSGSRFLQPALRQDHWDAARRISKANSGVISTEIAKLPQKKRKAAKPQSNRPRPRPRARRPRWGRLKRAAFDR
jgi:hypothetical protein